MPEYTQLCGLKRTKSKIMIWILLQYEEQDYVMAPPYSFERLGINLGLDLSNGHASGCIEFFSVRFTWSEIS